MQHFLQLVSQQSCDIPSLQPAAQQNVALQVTGKVEQYSIFRNVARQVATCDMATATCVAILDAKWILIGSFAKGCQHCTLFHFSQMKLISDKVIDKWWECTLIGRNPSAIIMYTKTGLREIHVAGKNSKSPHASSSPLGNWVVVFKSILCTNFC